MAAQADENKRSPLKAWVRALERTAPIEKAPDRTFPALVQELAQRFESAPALLSKRTSMSFRELAEALNRHARWALGLGLTSGDLVCLYMENCPEYLAIWLGLTRIGVTVALINTNLEGGLLLHSINAVSPRAVIASPRLAPVLAAIRTQLLPGVECWVHGDDAAGLPRADLAVAALPGDALDPGTFRAPTLHERALCIYTSGTTGLPKAANVSHYRLMQWSHWFAGLMDVTPGDRMFNCLPLYHSVGGVVATGASLVGGAAVVLRERFSAGTFWEDVAQERCTLFQYIGELCRYLINAPPRSAEATHSLRLACGNGLRGDVWLAFQERFRIPQILEYYAATEGNFSLYNCEGRPGAIGRIPPFLTHRTPVAVVRFDLEAGLPARDADGRCTRCAADEVGEAIGQIDSTARFEGYTDPKASHAKVLRDVFTPGDAWYRTGDLMRKDAQGFFYFVDRVGDTFRWKGENVSTTEVAAVVGAVPGVIDAAVYGVTVPHNEGRAGMVALVTGAGFSLAGFRQAVSERLPAYARPVFVRMLAALEITGTFKLRKQELALDGFDLSKVSDALYVNDHVQGEYVAITTAKYQELLAGGQRL